MRRFWSNGLLSLRRHTYPQGTAVEVNRGRELHPLQLGG